MSHISATLEGLAILAGTCRRSAAWYLRLAANASNFGLRDLATHCAVQRQQCAAALEGLGAVPPDDVELPDLETDVAAACVAHEVQVAERFGAIVDRGLDAAMLKVVLKQFERVIELHDAVLQAFRDEGAQALARAA